MTCLVTGAGGLIGSHLVEYLAQQGMSVTAVVRRPNEPLSRLTGDVDIRQGDMLDRSFVEQLVASAKPDQIFHLAAQSLPRTSWDEIVGTMQTNLLGSVYILEAMREHASSARMVMACSSSQYASSPEGAPIRERDLQEPLNPYAVSKMGQDQLSVMYGKKYDLAIMRVRPFFLIGPRKHSDFCSDFARRIAAIERGEEDVLRVGNIDAVRDLLHVDDGAHALAVIMEKGVAGEVYNVCSGEGYVIGDVLQIFKKLAKTTVREEKDPSLLRPLDEPVKIGDATKLRGLGWKPECAIEDAVRDILDYWREQAATT